MVLLRRVLVILEMHIGVCKMISLRYRFERHWTHISLFTEAVKHCKIGAVCSDIRHHDTAHCVESY